MGLKVKAQLNVGADTGQVIGYYGKKRRREGEIFEIEDVKHFSPRWMEAIDWTPGSEPKVMPTSDVIVEATDLRPPAAEETPAEAKARRRRERRAG